MKPLGRKYFNGKIDHHLHDKNNRKVANWWEDACTPNKDLERRLVKKEVEEQLASIWGEWPTKR